MTRSALLIVAAVSVATAGGVAVCAAAGWPVRAATVATAAVTGLLAGAAAMVPLVLTRGGKYVGIPATHMIPPTMPGFAQAGGTVGPGNDFYSNPNGSLSLAESYMKKAGYRSGKYTGPPLSAVGDNSAPAKETAEAFVQQMKQLGFNIQLNEVPHKTMYSEFCLVPKKQPAFCPNVAWGKDFFDSQSMIDPIFNGKNIVPSGNVNTAQANNPSFNARRRPTRRRARGTSSSRSWNSCGWRCSGPR